MKKASRPSGGEAFQLVPALYLSAFAWPGYLQPIDRFVPPDVLRDFLPSIVAQGTYRGRLYSLGEYDSGMGL